MTDLLRNVLAFAILAAAAACSHDTCKGSTINMASLRNHKFGRMKIAVPSDFEFNGSELSIYQVQVNEHLDPAAQTEPGRVLTSAWENTKAKLLEDQDYNETVLTPIPLGANATGVVVTQFRTTESADAVAVRAPVVLSLRSHFPGRDANELTAPLAEVLSAFHPMTPQEWDAAPLVPERFYTRFGFVALPRVAGRAERIAATWRRSTTELMISVGESDEAQDQSVVTKLFAGLAEWTLTTRQNIEKIRNRRVNVAGAEGDEIVLREDNSVRFLWRRPAPAANTMEVEIELSGMADQMDNLQKTWSDVLCTMDLGDWRTK